MQVKVRGHAPITNHPQVLEVARSLSDYHGMAPLNRPERWAFALKALKRRFKNVHPNTVDFIFGQILDEIAPSKDYSLAVRTATNRLANLGKADCEDAESGPT